ncbi:MAG: GLPGLI family protein [Bacteroidales bacterium]|nr:GLPGLI family protein [Bacteroidales bacterium]
MKNNNKAFTKTHIFISLTLVFLLTAFAPIRYDYPITNIEAAKVVVKYSLEYQQDSTSNYKKYSEMYLFIGKSCSKFLSKEMYRTDTVMRKIKNFEQLQAYALDRNRPSPKILYKIFKNYPKGKITFIEHVLPSTLKYQEDLNIFKWKLCKDTATIRGCKVQKALCNYGGRKWIAWFCPEIPYSDGPYKFNGLPGLILKIHDTRNHYSFEVISIEKPWKNLMIDMREKDFVETTKQEFFRAKDSFREDIISRAQEAGLSSEDQQTAAKTMAKRNNPLELKRN